MAAVDRGTSLNYCGHRTLPRHCHGVARYVDEYKTLVGLDKSLHHLVLIIGQGERLAVVALGILIVALVESAEEHHVVGLARLVNGLGYKLLGRAAVSKLLSCGHAVVLACDVANISAGIVNLDVHAFETSLQTVERQFLMLRLERRAAAAYGLILMAFSPTTSTRRAFSVSMGSTRPLFCSRTMPSAAILRAAS